MDKRRNITKRILALAGAAILLIILILTAITAVKGYRLVNPARKALVTTPDELDLFFENIEVNTGSNNLSGWFIPAQQRGDEAPQPSDRTVIVSHNYQSNREMVEISGLYYARHLAEAGYNVLMFDYSGSGLSDGEGYTLGCKEKDELLSVISYVKQQYPGSRIALHGWAFGAAAAIEAGAESNDVTAIIADSSYQDLNANLDAYLPIWTGLPFLFNAPVKSFAQLFSGTEFSESSPMAAMKNMSGKNIFFIHGLSDSVIAPDDSRNLYNAAKENNKAEIWLISNCRHIYGFMEQEDNYTAKTINFLNSAMG